MKKILSLLLLFFPLLCNAQSTIIRTTFSSSSIYPGTEREIAVSVPPTIGVFVGPGVIKNASGEVVRYNRSNEFDRVDGRFASFLEKEIFPFVESLKLDDGTSISLPADANERAITGASSGGIAAFVAAWERPDLSLPSCPTRSGISFQCLVPMKNLPDFRQTVRSSFTV